MSFPLNITTAIAEKFLANPNTQPHLRAIISAVYEYGIDWFCLCQTNEPIPEKELSKAKAFFALISDDEYSAKGPNAFDQHTIRTLIERSSCIVIESGDIVVDHYSDLTTLAGQLKTGTAIIETKPDKEQEWLDYVRSISSSVPVIISCTFLKARAV